MAEKLYELWFRIALKKQIKDQTLTLAVRPYDRRCPNPKCVNVGETVRLRLLLKPGDEASHIQPDFDSYQSLAIIKDIISKPLGDLTNNDLIGASPDCLTKEAARCHLGLIYNREFSDDDIISLVKFDYLEDGDEH